MTSPISPELARVANFDLLDLDLATDVKAAVSAALRDGAVFPDGPTPLDARRGDGVTIPRSGVAKNDGDRRWVRANGRQ